jgi:hypothetical protein
VKSKGRKAEETCMRFKDVKIGTKLMGGFIVVL